MRLTIQQKGLWRKWSLGDTFTAQIEIIESSTYPPGFSQYLLTVTSFGVYFCNLRRVRPYPHNLVNRGICIKFIPTALMCEYIDINKNLATPGKTIPAPKELEYDIHADTYWKLVVLQPLHAGHLVLKRQGTSIFNSFGSSHLISKEMSAFFSCANHCIDQLTQTIGLVGYHPNGSKYR